MIPAACLLLMASQTPEAETLGLARSAADALWSAAQGPRHLATLLRDVERQAAGCPPGPDRDLLEATRGALLEVLAPGRGLSMYRNASTRLLKTWRSAPRNLAALPHLERLRAAALLGGISEADWLAESVALRCASSRGVDPALEADVKRLFKARYGGFLEPPEPAGTLEAASLLLDLWLRHPDTHLSQVVLAQGFEHASTAAWQWVALRARPEVLAQFRALFRRMDPVACADKLDTWLPLFEVLVETPVGPAVKDLMQRIRLGQARRGEGSDAGLRLALLLDTAPTEAAAILEDLAGSSWTEGHRTRLERIGSALDRHPDPEQAARVFRAVRHTWKEAPTDEDRLPLEPWIQRLAAWKRVDLALELLQSTDPEAHRLQLAQLLAGEGRFEEALSLARKEASPAGEALQIRLLLTLRLPQDARNHLEALLDTDQPADLQVPGLAAWVPLALDSQPLREVIARRLPDWRRQLDHPVACGQDPATFLAFLDPECPPPPTLSALDTLQWKVAHLPPRKPEARGPLEDLLFREARAIPAPVPWLGRAWLAVAEPPKEERQEGSVDWERRLEASRQALAHLAGYPREAARARDLQVIALSRLERWPDLLEAFQGYLAHLEAHTDPDAFGQCWEAGLPVILLLDRQGRQEEALRMLRRLAALVRRLPADLPGLAPLRSFCEEKEHAELLQALERKARFWPLAPRP